MLLNYTTKIDPDKTCAEIAKILSKHGAQAVMTEYDPKNQLISALSFKIAFGEKQIAFRLPADWRPVQRVLQEQGVKGVVAHFKRLGGGANGTGRNPDGNNPASVLALCHYAKRKDTGGTYN